MDAATLVQQFETLQGRRFNFDSLWQDVKDITWPESSDFLQTTTPGERKAQRQYDMTAALALDKFAAVLESLLTPRQQRFHSLRPSLPELEKDRSVNLFFEELNNLMFKQRQRPGANFYDEMHLGWMSHGAYGTKTINVDVPIEGKGLSYRNISMSAVWIEVDSRGNVDTVFYKFEMSAHAAMERWGPERAPKCVHDSIKRGKEWDRHEFLHVVKPRRDRNPNAIGPERFRFESWELGLKDREFIPWQPFPGGPLMKSGGYDTNPYTVSRFSVVDAREMYGRGPAIKVLADNGQLQEMERSTTLAGQIASEPPLLTMSDSMFGEASSLLDLRPSAMNAGWLDAQGNPRAKPLVSGFNFPLSEEMKERKRTTINDAHFITLFQILVDTPNMTATEALLRAQEKGMLIAPVVGRQQSETLGKVIERELDLLAQQDLIPEVPPVLAEAAGEYEIEYSSQATRLQREEEVQGILATAQDLQMLGAADPTALEVLDSVESARFIAKARGVPQHLVRDERTFMKRIEQQAEAAEKAAMAEGLPDLARAAKDASAAGLDVEGAASAMM